MLPVAVYNAALFGAGAFLSSLAAMSLVSRRLRRGYQVGDGEAGLSGSVLVFLIHGEDLIDANFAGHRFVDSLAGGAGAVQRLLSGLARSFSAPERLLDPDDGAPVRIVSRDGRLQAEADRVDDRVRIRIVPQTGQDPAAGDVHRLAALEAELDILRAHADCAPYLAWREAADGEVVWMNAAYRDLAARRFGENRLAEWPLPRLFPDLALPDPAAGPGHRPRRVALDAAAQGVRHWFDCHAVRLGEDVFFTAWSADATVHAEQRLRAFTQTLTLTFAQLTVGLAIFDRERHLVLFNPALVELTGLPSDYLASRPPLVGVLDRLRERRMLPEPRDYKSWRQSIARLEAEAVDGSYSEAWPLPDGRTFRMTGRPHPDGAIAFLIEDISTEIGHTRQVRAELELTQAAIESVDEAIAVFSPAGLLILSNRAYRQLWQTEFGDDRLGEITVNDATRDWHDKTVPTPVWGDFRDFALTPTDRVEWTATVHLTDGRALSCRFTPMPGGATLAGFRPAPRVVRRRSDATLRHVG